jgi:hypothetical protein
MPTNVTIVTGNLGKDPAVSESKDGIRGRFNLAHHERYKRGDGTPAIHTNWFRVVVSGTRANALLLLRIDFLRLKGRPATGPDPVPGAEGVAELLEGEAAAPPDALPSDDESPC